MFSPQDCLDPSFCSRFSVSLTSTGCGKSLLTQPSSNPTSSPSSRSSDSQSTSKASILLKQRQATGSIQQNVVLLNSQQEVRMIKPCRSMGWGFLKSILYHQWHENLCILTLKHCVGKGEKALPKFNFLKLNFIQANVY